MPATSKQLASNWSFLPLNSDKAWLLGLVYGNGSLAKAGYVVRIYDGDRALLETANALFGGKLKITRRPGTGTYCLTICSKRIWQELHTNFHLVNDKCWRLVWPKQMPVRLVRHFVRGLVDTDGSFSVVAQRSNSYLHFEHTTCTRTFGHKVHTVLKRNRAQTSLYVRAPRPPRDKRIQYRTGATGLPADKVGQYIYNRTSPRHRSARKFSIWHTYHLTHRHLRPKNWKTTSAEQQEVRRLYKSKVCNGTWTRADVARYVKRSHATVSKWLQDYHPADLRGDHNKGSSRKLRSHRKGCPQPPVRRRSNCG